MDVEHDDYVPTLNVESEMRNFPPTNEPWQTVVDRQDNELKAWLDAFLESDEYAALLRQKVRAANVSPHSPVTHRDKKTKRKLVQSGFDEKNDTKNSNIQEKLSFLENVVGKSLESLRINNTIRNQRKGICIIQQKIIECRNYYRYHHVANENAKLAGNHKTALNLLNKIDNIDVPTEGISTKLMDKIIQKRRASRSKNITLNVAKNKTQIIKRLLRELNRDRQIKYKSSKIKRNVKQKKSSLNLKDVEESTNFISLDEAEESVTGESDLIANLQKTEPKVKIKSPKIKVSRQTKSANKSTKSSKPKVKEKKGKQNVDKKHGKEKQMPQDDGMLPVYIPIVNPRKKGRPPENVLNQLLDDFTKLYDYLKEKEKYELEILLNENITAPIDNGIFSKPDKVIFKDFQQGHIYKKYISLVNGSTFIKKIRFERIIWNSNIDDENLLDVQHFGNARMVPGMGFQICLRFSPEVLNNTVDGKIIFITNNVNLYMEQQFIIHVVCVPICSAVSITPTIISFDELPIWRARNLKRARKNFKTITISNSGAKECKITIRKNFNIQTIEQEWKKIISIIRIDSIEKKPISSSNLGDLTKADPFPKNLVQQCVENVFNIFKFERNIFIVKPKSTAIIKCWFRDMSDVGYQVESYTFSVYERFRDSQLYCIGTQDIIVDSETTSQFLIPSVEILDFEVCVYGSAYQLDFDISNPCKLSHHIRIGFPSTMKPYLKSNIVCATILPKENLKVFVTFLPSSGIIFNNKFYDSNLGLLEFPIYIKVETRGYEDTPLIKIDVYAAVTEANGVRIIPVDYTDVICGSNECHIDMGNCTIMESVYTTLEIQNISLAPQQFGFLSLPKVIL